MGPSNKSATTFETLKRQLDVARDGIEAQVAERTATLKASEEKFRALVEMTSDWIWEVDVSGIYTYTSPRVEALLGFKPEEVLGKTPFYFMVPEEARRIEAEFANIAAERRPFHALENRNVHKDGHIVVLETSGVPFWLMMANCSAIVAWIVTSPSASTSKMNSGVRRTPMS